jgi:GNAT superfamily N-acetyltransferase
VSYVIRGPKLSDSSGLYELIQQHAAFEKSAAPLRVIELVSLLNKEAVRFLVAVEGQTLLGYAAITFDWSIWRAKRYAHLDCLFVSSVHRGGGIGKQLLAEAKIVARLEGVDRMEWQTPAWNEQAIRFYHREGAGSQDKSRFVMPLA